MTVKVSLEELLKSGAHFGHQKKRWNPRMEEYLHAVEEGVYVFDLIKTKQHLEDALQVLSDTAKSGGTILILGTKKQAKEKVAEIAEATGVFAVTERWLGGTLTNLNQIKVSLRKLADMKTKLAAGDYKSHTKKERLLIRREINRLERFFGGVATLEKLPDLLVIVDTKREQTALREAKTKGVTTIGIVDSNADPSVDYPIPMNDDATGALTYVLDLMQQAIVEGQKKIKVPKDDKKASPKKTK